jgi:hypothetical protein
MTGTPTSRSRIHPRGPTATLGIALLVLASACELPTSVPRIEQRWVVPAQSTTIAVADLLPAGVEILPDSSAFSLVLGTSVMTRLLKDDCATCAASNGTTIPKPAFSGTSSANMLLPADLASATLSGGAMQVTISNHYNFDPLRPSATARGYFVVTVSTGGTIIGKDSIDGATTAMPSGFTPLIRTIPFSGTLGASAPIAITATLSSPAGDPVTINANSDFIVSATSVNLRFPSAALAVSNRQISSTSTLDLSDIDESIRKRVDAGALQLDVDNPFNVAGTLTLQFSPSGGQPISKSVALVSGTSHPVIPFTQAELQPLLGHTVTLTLSGPVSSTGGAVVVSPKQAVVVTTRLDISLHTGG